MRSLWVRDYALAFGAIVCCLPSRAAAQPAEAAPVRVEIVEGPCFKSANAAAMQKELWSLQLRQTVTVRVQERAGLIALSVLQDGALLGTRAIEAGGASCEDQLGAALLAVTVALEDAGLAQTAPAVEPPLATEPASQPRAPEPPLEPDAPATVEPLPTAAPSTTPAPPDRGTAPSSERGGLRAGVAAEVGVGVALTAAASMTTSALFDVAYAPRTSPCARCRP